jgi:hypothetical protein
MQVIVIGEGEKETEAPCSSAAKSAREVRAFPLVVCGSRTSLSICCQVDLLETTRLVQLLQGDGCVQPAVNTQHDLFNSA